MNITIEELEKLEPGTFDVIDMRGETEIAMERSRALLRFQSRSFWRIRQKIRERN